MKKEPTKDPDMQAEYDFASGIRGKHYLEFVQGSTVVVLAPDVAERFRGSEVVNLILRAADRFMGRYAEIATKLPDSEAMSILSASAEEFFGQCAAARLTGGIKGSLRRENTKGKSASGKPQH